MLQTTEACENMTSDLTPKHRLMCSHMLAESPRELHLSEDGRVDPGSCGQQARAGCALLMRETS